MWHLGHSGSPSHTAAVEVRDVLEFVNAMRGHHTAVDKCVCVYVGEGGGGDKMT